MDRRWPLIGITGLATAGKDTVAKRLISRWGFVRIGFADTLKVEVKQRFRRTLLAVWQHSAEGGEVPEGTSAQDALVDLLLDTKPPIVRALLQEYGTEVRRADMVDYWVDRWLERAGEDWDRRIVVPDMRFGNEAAVLKRWGVCVKVVRPGTKPASGHASETEAALWPDSMFDRIFQNTGTVQDLIVAVDDWVAGQYDRWR